MMSDPYSFIMTMDEDEEEMIPIKSDKDGARNKIEDFGNVIFILIFT